MHELFGGPAAIGVRICDYVTQLSVGQPFPGHVDRRELPVLCAGHARSFLVVFLMARAAPHTRRPAIVRASRHSIVVNALFVTLMRRVAARVTVDAAWTAQYRSDLVEL